MTKTIFLLSFLLLFIQCNYDIMTLDIQGHRGCRGLFPENTIPAFLHAMDLGVHTLEFDVVISKDHQVIVSHDPYMSHHISTLPDGSLVTEENEKDHNIYKLDYTEIKSYDVGLKEFPRFPDQQKIQVHKPSLKDLIQNTEEKNNKILYNIEIKRTPAGDKIFHPEYQLFADLVIGEITELGIMNRTTVQCFDIATLQYLHETYPEVKLVYLIENEDLPVDNINKLGFIPHVYSPYYKLVDTELVKYCKNENMQVIPWTVNETADMNQLIDLGVDGIITDYPDRLISLYDERLKK